MTLTLSKTRKIEDYEICTLRKRGRLRGFVIHYFHSIIRLGGKSKHKMEVMLEEIQNHFTAIGGSKCVR